MAAPSPASAELAAYQMPWTSEFERRQRVSQREESEGHVTELPALPWLLASISDKRREEAKLIKLGKDDASETTLLSPFSKYLGRQTTVLLNFQCFRESPFFFELALIRLFMEEQLNSLAVTHLLQHTLRSLCCSKNSQWIYAVFWRILPRNYPPPKWDFEGGVYDRNRGNRRNWILAWEDGFCNFAASSSAYEAKGLQPQLFFKMSHEIYNYGEGLIGKVAADHSYKYVFKDPKLNELNSISTRNNPSDDAEPRTWEAQFQSGIKTITLVAVKEGVVQLGSFHKVMEDLSFILLLREKFSYLESIPGVLLPHPSSTAALASFSVIDGCNTFPFSRRAATLPSSSMPSEFYDHYLITPSISSLELLLSRLPTDKSFPLMGAKEKEMIDDGN